MNRIAMWQTEGVLLAFVAAGTVGHTTVWAQNADFKGFPDVPKTHWAYQAVTDLAQKGILQGYPAEKSGGKLTFHPPVQPATPAAGAATRKPTLTRKAVRTEYR